MNEVTTKPQNEMARKQKMPDGVDTIGMSGITVPKLIIAQPNVRAFSDKKIPEGAIIETNEHLVLAKPGESLEVIFLFKQQKIRLYDVSDPTKRIATFDADEQDMARGTFERTWKGINVRQVPCHYWIVLLASDLSFPAIMPFKSSGMGISKKVGTILFRKGRDGYPCYSTVVKLSTQKADHQNYNYFVYKTIGHRDATKHELASGMMWFKETRTTGVQEKIEEPVPESREFSSQEEQVTF